jgi:Tfp pilus assembly protein PilO
VNLDTTELAFNEWPEQSQKLNVLIAVAKVAYAVFVFYIKKVFEGREHGRIHR